MRNTLFLISVLAFCSACDPTVFDDIADESPVITLSTTAEMAPAYGAQVVSVLTEDETGELHSRVFVGGGPGSSVTAFHAAHDDDFLAFDREASICAAEGECGENFASRIAALPLLAEAGSKPRRGCVAMADPKGGIYLSIHPTSGQELPMYQEAGVHIGCDDDFSTLRRFGTPVDANGFGTAMAGTTSGVLFVAAPGTICSTGAASLYVLRSGGWAEVELADGATCREGFGEKIALVEREESVTNEAAVSLATISTTGDVVVHEIKVGASEAEAETEMKIGEASEEGDLAIAKTSGQTWLAFLRLDGDVAIHRVDSGSTVELSRVSCPFEESAECQGFGRAIEFADVDASGVPAIFVGAPQATVNGVERAGVVFGYGLDASGAVASSDPVVLTLSMPDTNDDFGSAISATPTNLEQPFHRDEIVIGASGKLASFAYLCSGLRGDSVAEGVSRCRP